MSDKQKKKSVSKPRATSAQSLKVEAVLHKALQRVLKFKPIRTK